MAARSMSGRMPVAERPKGDEASAAGRFGSLRSLSARLAAWPWWVHVLLIFVASRIVTTAMLLFFAAHQAANSWTGPSPDYFSYSQAWDSHWYYLVAVNGYPRVLPVDDGYVGQNTWAFLPVYPWLVQGLAILTAIPYAGMAVIVSVLASLGTALLAFKLWREAGLSAAQSLGAVALLCVNPVSTVLQIGYAEPLQLLLLTAGLLHLQRHRYWLTIPFVVLSAFTRPGALAFALAIGLHVILRWAVAWRASREGGSDQRAWMRVVNGGFPIREQVAAIVAAAAALVAGLAWPLIAAAATGSSSAYTDTEMSWRTGYIGHTEFAPFTGWILAAQWWAEWVHLPGWLGIVVLALSVAALAVLAFSPWARRLGPTIRLWFASWLVYLFAVFFPQSSTWRLLLPAYPMLGAFAVSRRWVLWAVIALSLVGQWFWIDQEWAIAGYDWTPP